MEMIFRYNWMVREEWFRWCEDIPEEELLKVRTGGVGGILHTLFHIIDAEWSWLQILQGKPDFLEKFEDFNNLKAVRDLSAKYHQDVEPFVRNWDSSMESRVLEEPNADGTVNIITYGEVMRHVLAHEIHHIGQLSVWSRELGKRPVSANLIRRGLVTVNK